MRVQTTEQIERLKDTTVGELIDDTMKVVKKHPGLSVIAATMFGFFLGQHLKYINKFVFIRHFGQMVV